MGRKESNQTNKNHVIAHFMYLLGQDTTIYIPYLSWLILPPFIFQADIYIADLFFSCCRADAFIKYNFLQLNWLFIYMKKKFQRNENLSQLIYIWKIIVINNVIYRLSVKCF